MTTHELARQLLALKDVPIVHLHTHFDYVDNFVQVNTIGINLLEENGVLQEVGLYPEKLIREEGGFGVIDHTLEENCD
jgi:hypothetical protein